MKLITGIKDTCIWNLRMKTTLTALVLQSILLPAVFAQGTHLDIKVPDREAGDFFGPVKKVVTEYNYDMSDRKFKEVRLYDEAGNLKSRTKWDPKDEITYFATNTFDETGCFINQRVEDLGENLEEVVLTVTVTAMVGEKTAYLAEVAQAGIFLIDGFNDQARHAIVNTFCPNTLFPYARTAITNLVADGGFPPLTLQPVNFEQLYAQRMQQLAAEQGQAGGGGPEETVTAEFNTND